jgi:exopolysaccharide biosynthesis polyprenyl glycosylphosphotransferase
MTTGFSARMTVDNLAPEAQRSTENSSDNLFGAEADNLELFDNVGKSRRRVMSREWARVRCYCVLALGDALGLIASFHFANAVYIGEWNSAHGTVMLAAMMPVFLGAAGLIRAYDGATLAQPHWGAFRVLQALAFAAVSMSLIVYFLKAGSEFSRAVFSIGVLSSAVVLPGIRWAMRPVLLRWLGGTPFTTVVIRDGVSYEPLEDDIIFDRAGLNFDPFTRDPHHYHALAEAVGEADRVIVVSPESRYIAWASVLKSMALNGEIVTAEDDPLGVIGVSRHAGRRTLIVSAGPLHLRERILKRAFDVVGAALGLVVLGPVMIATAIAIRLESTGPALFRQDRIGRDNKIFRMYKFRSMYADKCDAQADRLTSRADDPRVTRVGRFIRKTSIDELPQLINVLIGDMSLVGPRPHAIGARAANLLYWDIDARYRHRHAMKPGLTGLAQIRGYRGATDRAEDLTNRLQSDLEYVANWSLWNDIRIVTRTVAVMKHDNAF